MKKTLLLCFIFSCLSVVSCDNEADEGTSKPIMGNFSYVKDTQTVVLTNDSIDCKGIKMLVIPQGGAHVRSMEIRFPKATDVYETDFNLCNINNSNNVFAITHIKTAILGTETQIAIQADNTNSGVQVPDTILCTYEILAKQ